MAIKETLVVELAKIASARIKELSTDKAALQENVKSPSTAVGALGIGGLAVFSPELHSAVGGTETLEQQIIHGAIAIAELAIAIVSTYLAAKKPNKNSNL